MAAAKSVKARKTVSRIVGVITTTAELRAAIEMSDPPDLFELRLDRLVGDLDELEEKIPRLRAPLIITARHPAEGGANDLSKARRAELLSRFLPGAQYVDLELRSLKALRSSVNLSSHKHVRLIVSFHDFKATPGSRSLHAKARAAKAQGADIFKVATRTDRPAQLARLLDFVAKTDVSLPISAMGMGKLGRQSRIVLARHGSVLNYASIGKPRVKGQLSIKQLRAAREVDGPLRGRW